MCCFTPHEGLPEVEFGSGLVGFRSGFVGLD